MYILGNESPPLIIKNNEILFCMGYPEMILAVAVPNWLDGRLGNIGYPLYL